MTHEQRERDRYDFDGRAYAGASAHQTNWGERVAGELELDGSEEILDLGCGDGRVSRVLALRVPRGHVLGIDSSPSMIAAAEQHHSANLRFELQDIGRMPYCDQFNVVFSHAALHWVPDHGNLMRRVHNALREGGYARLNFAGHGACARLIEVLNETINRPRYASHFEGVPWPWNMPKLAAMRELLDEGPFEKSIVREEVLQRLFPDRDTLVRWIDQPCLVPFLACLPEEKRAGFRELVIDAMIRRTQQRDEGYLETFVRIDIVATK